MSDEATVIMVGIAAILIALGVHELLLLQKSKERKMKKSDELADPKSCWSKAADDAIVFVLIDTDEDMPGTIEDWVRRRIARGKNRHDDAKMVEARACAAAIRKKQLEARK